LSNPHTNAQSIDSLELTIIIPAYNEESRIPNTMTNIINYFDLYMFGKYELLVVIDGCIDDTELIVTRYQKKHKHVVPLIFPNRLGKGGAILASFSRVRSKVILMTDADGSVSPDDLYKLYNEVCNADLCIGSRYSSTSKQIKHESMFRIFLSRGFNTLLHMSFWRLMKYTDTQCGAKAFRKKSFSTVYQDLILHNFCFDVNLIYSMIRCGFKVKEIGVTYVHEDEGSKISHDILNIIVNMFISIVILRIYYSRFRNILLNNFISSNAMRAVRINYRT